MKLCGNVQCHQYATCDRGQCRCVTGYDGDGYSDCRPVTEGKIHFSSLKIILSLF